MPPQPRLANSAALAASKNQRVIPANSGENDESAAGEGRERRERRLSERELARRQEEAERAERRLRLVTLAKQKTLRAQQQHEGEEDNNEENYCNPLYMFDNLDDEVPTRHTILAERRSKVPPSPYEYEYDADVNDDEPRDMSRASSPAAQTTRSSSPIVGDKRSRSSSDIGDTRPEKMTKTSYKGRPKLKEQEQIIQDILEYAIPTYRCLITTEFAFPDHSQEREMSHRAWVEGGCLAGLEQVPAMTTRISKLITSRGAQVRGEMKTKAKAFVASHYGFRSGHHKKILQYNRALAGDLKERNGFACTQIYDLNGQLLSASERKGLYKNAAIQTLTNNMWFQNRRDEGIVYSQYFQPMTIPCLALILTVLECCVDEWETGTKIDIPFNANEYKGVYLAQVRDLETFTQRTSEHRILPRILKKLHDEGRFHAGAEPIVKNKLTLVEADILAVIKEAEEDTEASDEE